MSRINLYKKWRQGFHCILVRWDFGKVKSYELFKTFACAKHNSQKKKDKCYYMSLHKAALKWPETFGWLES